MLPSEITVVASGVLVAAVLLVFMAIGLFLDMSASGMSSQRLKPFSDHLKRNSHWWNSFERHFQEYLKDSSVIEKSLKNPNIFANDLMDLNRLKISQSMRIRYIISYFVVSRINSLATIPEKVRLSRLANLTYRRTEAFMLSFSMNYADASKGDLIIDDIRVWRMSSTIAAAAGFIVLQILAKYGWTSLIHGYALISENSNPPFFEMVIAFLPVFVALAMAAFVERLTTGFIASRAYDRYCTSLFAATYVGYIRHIKGKDITTTSDALVPEQNTIAIRRPLLARQSIENGGVKV